MALRQLRVFTQSVPRVRYYAAASNVPAKPVATSNIPERTSPPGTMGDPAPSSSVNTIHPPIGPIYKSQGTSVARTIRNIWKAGWRRAFWQIKEMNDTKVSLCGSNGRLARLLEPIVLGIDTMRIWGSYPCVNDGWSIKNHTSMTALKLSPDGRLWMILM
jgi:hypothetical protein